MINKIVKFVSIPNLANTNVVSVRTTDVFNALFIGYVYVKSFRGETGGSNSFFSE